MGTQDRREFETLRIPERYWNEENVIIADPYVTIFRMPDRAISAPLTRLE
jgi:hypothetical protein